MNRKIKLNYDALWQDLYPRIPVLIKNNRGAASGGAILGIGGGIFSFFAAVGLDAGSWLTNQTGSEINLSGLSIYFFFLVLPLLSLGAHCLDLLERKAATLSQLNQN